MGKEMYFDMLLPDNVKVESAEALQEDLIKEFSPMGIKHISVTPIYHGYKLMINEDEWNTALRCWGYGHYGVSGPIDAMKVDIFRSKLILFFAEVLPMVQNINSIRLYSTYPPMNMKTVVTVQTKYGDLKLEVSTVNIYRGEQTEYETSFYGYSGYGVEVHKHSRVKSMLEAELHHNALIASIKMGYFEFVPKIWGVVEKDVGEKSE